MKIKYDKCELRKTIYSALCILLFIFAFIILEYKSKKIALLIVLMPAMLGILIKTVRLLVYLKINHNKIWMEINNKNIIYYSIDNQKVEIPILNITNIIFDVCFRSSYHSIVVVGIVYVICVILFLPQKGIGRKFIKNNLKR